MATSIGVQETTRDRLERIKRDVGAPSLEAVLTHLLAEHDELKARAASDRLLQAITRKRKELGRFAQRHGIRTLAVFGSALHGDALPGSDLDLLVEFERARTPGLVGLGSLQRELSQLLGVPVDLQTLGSFGKPLRDQILAEAVKVHDAA